MATQAISAVFDHWAEAENAVGRLEVAGIPAADITVLGSNPVVDTSPHNGRTVVTACVETRLIEKAMGILTAEGRVDGQIASQ